MREYILTPEDDLQAAFDTARPGDILRLSAGSYRRKTVIRTPGLTILGSGPDKTRLVWDDYALKKDALGRDLNTFRTYTLAVCAENVTIEELAVVNDSFSPECKGQEVALSVVAPGFRMRRCLLSSTQDTLFLGPLPDDLIRRYEGFLPDELRRGGEMDQILRECRIEGTVDFIFGCGNALLENCELRSLRDARNIGYVAAPAHELRQERGFRFVNCRFTRQEGVGAGTIYLARPWRDYGLCLFESCSYGPHIAAAGFDKWNDTSRDKTARFYEHPPVKGRVPWVRGCCGKASR